MDKVTQRLFGIAAIIFAFAFLIRTASPAQADNTPETTYSTGKYMMEMACSIDSDDYIIWYILVWDTESGRSKFYYTSNDVSMSASSDHFQLPSSPL